MLARRAFELTRGDQFVALPGFEQEFFTWVKLEGLNSVGSIKLKPALRMIERAEETGLIHSGSRLIESTSGNLGIALAAICAAKGYRITLVTDVNVNPRTAKYIKALGAELVVVEHGETGGGFVHSRLEVIRRRLAADPGLVWLNQYTNPANAEAHHLATAPEIFEGFGIPDYLFIGAGTSGTLMGCLSYLRERRLSTRIVAVDSEGSVLFGTPPGRRYIPGLGASRRPEIFVDDGTFEKVLVPEVETVRMCRRVAREHGLLLGGSSGTVLAAVAACANTIPSGSTVLTLSSDMGDGYLDTIYDDVWVVEHFGLAPLTAPPVSATTDPALTGNE